jgi:hypothetical protein
MKRCVLQIVSKIRQRVKLDDLCTATMSISYQTIDANTLFAHREVHLSIAFFPALPYYDLQREFQMQDSG